MSRSGPRLLVVDDEPAIRQALTSELETDGYDVTSAVDGAAALALAEEDPFDLVLTDLAMPRMDGFELIRRLRGLRGDAASTPIVVLSVRGEEQDKVKALDLGADDFVTKPFALAELRARVRAQLRRSGRGSEVLRFNGLTLDLERRQVFVDGQPVRLTPTELAILELLTRQAGKPVTLRQIVAKVWHGAPGTSDDTVRVHVGSLRKKLESNPAEPRFLLTEPWVGYRFIAEPI
ncbi:MAG: response regulator transcription factor [Acidobacteriota bacterium]